MFENIPVEILSNIVSFVVIGAIVVRLLKYKKRVKVIEGLQELNDKNQLTEQDKDYISKNIIEYKAKFEKQEAFNKLTYPVFILITGIFFAFFEVSQAMIFMNIVVVTYIYLFLRKTHYKNYIDLLKAIKF